jgi:hypothetical protein
MKTRVLIVISVWVSTVVGAARLFGAIGARAAAAMGVLAVSVSLAARLRRRFRRWDRPGESDFPPGPRRVLLAETGLSGRQ